MTPSTVFTAFEILVVASPVALIAALGLATLMDRPFSERVTSRLTQLTVATGLLSAVIVLAVMFTAGDRDVPLELGDWVVVPGVHRFHFTLKFVFDRLSVPFVILSYVLIGVVGYFANAYLHREAGYNRFFVFYAIFLCGMVISSLAGTIETLFAGWELVGLSSALLVAYFHERQAPVRNGMRVWAVYRVADAAFLVAAVALHHLTGEGDFARLMGSGDWPTGHASLAANQAMFVGALLLIAAAGKSALVPFSGWLPRAMEGPTPSSAVFYGSLSVHLGAFLLLRVAPLLERSAVLSMMVFGLGLVTALYASVCSRVQTDIKSALAFASMTQVGIIVAEIGLGLYYVALIHIIGHACLRTLQLLRAPSLLHDYRSLENALGTRLPHPARPGMLRVGAELRTWVYRFASERGHLDTLLGTFVVDPFIKTFRACDAFERRVTCRWSGPNSDDPRLAHRHPELMDELL